MSVPERRAMVERPGKFVGSPAMCAAESGAFGRLSRRAGHRRRRSGLDAADRRIASEVAVKLNQAGHGINRKRVQRLMRVMGIEALVPRPGTSKPAPGHKIYPYLLYGLAIAEPNHVWAADITPASAGASLHPDGAGISVSRGDH